MVRLNAILAAHAPLYAVARDGSGVGTVLHWSHLLDSLLLLLGAPVAWAIGWPAALQAVSVVVGPLSLGLLGIAVCWAGVPFARGLNSQAPLWLGGLAVGLATPVAGYGVAGVVHHHVLLVLCAAMAAGWAVRCIGAGGQAPGVAFGAWAGAGLWLSPESLPFSVMALGAMAVAWFLRPNCRRISVALAASGLSFVVVTVLAWLVDPPLAGYGASEPDRLSVMYALFAGGVALCTLLARMSLRQPALRARLQAAFGAAAIAAAWLAAYPEVLRGTQGLMDAEQAHVFFGAISEMAPVRTAQEGLEFLLTGVLGVVFLTVAAVQRRSALVSYAAFCAVVMILMAASHLRFAAYPAALAAGLLPVAMARLDGLTAAAEDRTRMLARLALLACVLLLPKLWIFNASARPETELEGPNACDIAEAAALLADHPGEVVLSSVNDVPELLRRTGVLTVGSLYHRNPAAFMRLRAAWRSMPGALVPAELDAARVGLVLICPGPDRSPLVVDLPPGTLLDRLEARQPPPWLTLIGGRAAGGYMLYRVAH